MSSDALPKTVEYVRLGQSGLKVSKIILGCMSYGSSKWAGWVLEEKEAMEHFKKTWEMGINTWDTADVYLSGVSEELVGKAIKQLKIPRDEIVILTKLFMTVGRDPSGGFISEPDKNGYVNMYGLSCKHIFEGVKASLDRLQLDYVDVLQCHRFD